MTVGQMNCRSNELSVKWTVGQMIVGLMIVGQMTQTPFKSLKQQKISDFLHNSP